MVSLGIGIGMELLRLGLFGPAVGSMRLKAGLLP